MISCFLERMRRKDRSFWGSISLTVLLAKKVRWRRSPAYWTAVELSKVVLMGIPEKIKPLESGSIIYIFYLNEKRVVPNWHDKHACWVTFCIDNYGSNDTFMRFDPFQCFLNFSLRHRMKSKTFIKQLTNIYSILIANIY